MCACLLLLISKHYRVVVKWFLLCCAMQVEVMDTNGAGDTFATAYMLALARWDQRPGETANWAASRAVGQQQVMPFVATPLQIAATVQPHGNHSAGDAY